MNRLPKHFLILALSLSGLFALASCDSFLEVSDPNSATPDNFFTSVDNFNSYLTDTYSAFGTEDDLHSYHYLAVMLQQAGFSGNSSWTGTADRNEIFNHSVSPTNGLMTGTWNSFYNVILQTNDIIIQGQEFMNNGDLSDSEMAQMEEILGQAYWIRAYSYFHLIRNWGVEPPGTDPSAKGVPLVLEIPDVSGSFEAPRATVGEVYDQILSDFQAAQERLPAQWESGQLGRPTSWAAKGFIGKVHLYRENWSEAASQFQDIVDNGPYSLASAETYYKDMFHESGDFASGNIFELNFLNDTDTNWWSGGAGHFVAVFNAPRGYGFSNHFVHQDNVDRLQEKNDPRLNVVALEPGADSLVIDGEPEAVKDHDGDLAGKQWSHRKYVFLDQNAFAANANGGSNIIVMRLADVMLMLAEARAEMGNSAGACDLIEEVRERAYTEVPGVTGDVDESEAEIPDCESNALEHVYEERYVELMAEGHRWFDMQRWERVEDLFERHPSGMKTAPSLGYRGLVNEIWPIPQDEIDSNPAIQQSSPWGGGS